MPRFFQNGDKVKPDMNEITKSNLEDLKFYIGEPPWIVQSHEEEGHEQSVVLKGAPFQLPSRWFKLNSGKRKVLEIYFDKDLGCHMQKEHWVED